MRAVAAGTASAAAAADDAGALVDGMTAALDAQGDQGLATAVPAVRGIGARGTRRLGEPNGDTRIAAFGAVAATLKGATAAGGRSLGEGRRGEGRWR